MTKTLTTEQLQDIYEAAVREEATGNPDESGEEAFDLLYLLDSTGGTGATIRKLIDLVRAANREAQPVAEVLSSRSGNDTSTIDKALPAGTKVYTAPPAPAVEESGARRCCKDKKCNAPIVGYSVDGLCEDCYMEMSKRPAPVVNPEFTSATAVPELITEDEQEEAVSDGYADSFRGGWNACRAAMLAQPVSQGGKLPPHAYRELVNVLRDTAVKYSGTDQLRERLNTALSKFIEPDHPHTRAVEQEGDDA